MNSTVYNISVLVGIALVGGGVALVCVPAALVTVGALVIGLTVFGARMSSRKG
jgi:hypothetical protein